MRAFIYPYKMASGSAGELSRALGVKRVRLENSKFRPHRNKLLINWGSSTMPLDYMTCHVLNDPAYVRVAADKLLALMKMYDNDVSIPDFTTREDNARWYLREGHAVVCRTELKGNSGSGIVIATTEQELVAAPLYTRYIKKKSEWRVHIFAGEVLMIQRKVRNTQVPDEEVNWQVRSHRNGFIFQQHDITPPIHVVEQAAKAVYALGLDFGAVDVIYNGYDDMAYVLEVNCAPGLEGTTLERYKSAIESVTNTHLKQLV